MKRTAASFADYQQGYNNAALSRDNGILVVKLQTGGGEFVWSAEAHEELGFLFADISTDRDNKVVVLTGTGTNFCAQINAASFKLSTPQEWDLTFHEGRRLLMNLLSIEVPVIRCAAVSHDILELRARVLATGPLAPFRRILRHTKIVACPQQLTSNARMTIVFESLFKRLAT